MGLLPPRARPVAGPIDGARTASAGSATTGSTCASALALWNTQRPDPEGASLRAHQLRGQPRRGREGVLVGARLDAHPLVHAVALQVSARASSPTPSWSTGTAAAAVTSTSSSWSTPGCSTSDRYFDVEIDVRQGRARRHLHLIDVTNRGPDSAPLHILPTLWFRNTWSWGRDNRHPQLARRRRTTSSSRRTALLGTRWLVCDGDAPISLFCENETNARAALRASTTRRRSPRTASTITSSTAPTTVNPTQFGTKAPPGTASTCRPVRPVRSACD